MAAVMDKKSKRTLYVGGLEKQVTEQVLHAAFVPFGPIKSVQVPMDYATQSSKGFGFVEYEDTADAQEAMDNMDESELFGRTLRVSIAKPDKPKLGARKPVWAETDEAKDTITPDEPEHAQQQPTVSSRVSNQA
uniref:RRM domain-containing protein n=1 Tax=Globisporangium ultimum (strain ATCC 200006 / CBS 805.95 / DAOM BR144) TaxID=431595 RepID=K3W6Z2_GLOUD